jgi:hypothetical protein
MRAVIVAFLSGLALAAAAVLHIINIHRRAIEDVRARPCKDVPGERAGQWRGQNVARWQAPPAEEQPRSRFASPWSCDSDGRHRGDGRRSLL